MRRWILVERWSLPTRAAAESGLHAQADPEDLPADLPVYLLPAAPVGEGPSGDPCGDRPRMRMDLEVDDGLTVPVAVGEQNAPLVLEATQRVRELREREKSAARPVADFGGDAPGFGGDW